MTDPSPPPQPPACGTTCCAASCQPSRALRAGRWSPYVVGVGIGVLSWITFAFMGKALGTSTTMVHASGLVCGVANSDYVQGNTYYASELNPAKGKMMFDWQFFLVVGLLLGAFASARLGRSYRVEHVPALWAARFGPSRIVRYLAAFVGGVILIYGARMAGGCTSGHGISGGLQLALSSWTFFVAMFVSGVVTAFALFGMKGRNHVVVN
jgi:uncharacterized membrane protein YedE/YeeE